MKVTVGLEVTESRTAEVAARLDRNGDALALQTMQTVFMSSVALAPFRTGRLKASHRVTQKGQSEFEMVVGAFYGIYVNNGTRHMAPQPFFSQACADGRSFLSLGIHGVLR